MSIYTYNNSSINSGALSQTETDLYGSSRLGMLKPNINVQSSLAGPAIGTKYITTFTRGNKIFELSNHLGNVLVTVSDKKIPVAKGTPNQAQVSYYTSDVLTANDYYPFGSLMSGRNYNASGISDYRFGFNGKENDNEVKGIEGGQQDYGMRIYDPRIGKFLSVDPISNKYPELTSYQFASNSPISGVDMDGLEYYYTADGKFLGKVGNGTQLRIATKYDTKVVLNENGGRLGATNIIQAWTEYKTNSEVTRLGRNEAGKFSGITKLSDDDLARLLAYGKAVIANEYKGSAMDAARNESGGKYGLIDFKFVAYDLLGIKKNDLLEINGVVYNPNEAGNYIWGILLTMYETAISPSMAAEIKTIANQGRHDEAYDQKAIENGEKLGDELLKENRADIQKDKCPNCPRGATEKSRNIFKKVKEFFTNGQAYNDLKKAKEIKIKS